MTTKDIYKSFGAENKESCEIVDYKYLAQYRVHCVALLNTGINLRDL
jgi:hypothetical protein